jgi:hypothetical protein
MQNALFKTDKPTAASGYVEFYDLSLIHEHNDGTLMSVVLEVHGWWDSETNRPIVDDTALSSRLEFKTFCEALDAYHSRRMALAISGFKHSFMWHPLSGMPAYYMPVDLTVDSPGEFPVGNEDGSFDSFADGA